MGATRKTENAMREASLKEIAATGHIDPMATFAEIPRMLPTFSTRAGRLRMIYVDAAGKQKALDINTADLTRIMHSAAVALESLTREKTMVEKIDALADEIMRAG
jgi:hypothetical protein